MRYNEFSIAVLEIPKVVNIGLIKSCSKKSEGIDQFTADIIVNSFCLETDSVDISEDLDEDDLFEIGTEALKRKKTAIMFLKKSVEFIFIPMLGFSSSIHEFDDATYLNIKGSMYLVAGGNIRYNSPSDIYKYIKAINMSGII